MESEKFAELAVAATDAFAAAATDDTDDTAVADEAESEVDRTGADEGADANAVLAGLELYSTTSQRDS